jgi:thiol-disulfide isomerase/thioredoxin
MKSRVIIIAILFLALVLLKCKSAESFNDYEDEEEGFADSGKSVIVCKADWCGHCKQAAPEFEKLMAASPMTLKDGTKVTVKVLDADHNKDEISQYKIRGYPTILISDGGNMTEYPGPRTYDGVFQFLNEM